MSILGFGLWASSRLRPFQYRYRIPVSVAVTVSGTVNVLNGTRYQHPDVGIGNWMSVSVTDTDIRYRHLLTASGGCRYRISISEPIPIPTSSLTVVRESQSGAKKGVSSEYTDLDSLLGAHELEKKTQKLTLVGCSSHYL